MFVKEGHTIEVEKVVEAATAGLLVEVDVDTGGVGDDVAIVADGLTTDRQGHATRRAARILLQPAAQTPAAHIISSLSIDSN